MKTALVDSDTGELLSETARARLVADYTDKSINEHEAKETVDMAEKFVSVIASRLEQLVVCRKDNRDEQTNDY